MTDFRQTCPHCGQHLRCDARLVGRTVRCPRRQQAILLAPKPPPAGDVKTEPPVPDMIKSDPSP